MSGSDSKSKGKSPATPATPAAPATPAEPGNMTIQPFMTPDMQGLLASQLAMGFGGQPSQYTSPLFQPMTIPNYAAGAPLVPGTTTAKTGNTGKSSIFGGGGGSGDESGPRFDSRGRIISKVSARPA
jgi:hypothetical protein